MTGKIFTIRFTDTAIQDLNLNPNTINGPSGDSKTTDIDLVGMGHVIYGEAILSNLLHLLENFACDEDMHVIQSVDDVTNTLTIATDVSASFPALSTFSITGSDTNNGTWTVSSVTYDNIFDVTSIVTVEDLLASVTLGDAGNAGIPNQSLPYSPTKPVTGQLWFNKTTGQLNVYKVSGWESVGNVTVSVSQPATPTVGELWWDSNVYDPSHELYGRQLSIYVGGSWIRVVSDYMPRNGSKVMTGTLDMNNNNVSNVKDPVVGTDAMSRDYADNRYVNVSGDTMTGTLNLTDAVATGTVQANVVISDTLMSAKQGLRVGDVGNSMPSIEFYDDTSSTWRTLRWNDTTSAWEVETNSGTFALIWTNLNDGIGSGLDADLFQGYTPSHFMTASNSTFTSNVIVQKSDPGVELIDTGTTNDLSFQGNIYTNLNIGYSGGLFGRGVAIAGDVLVIGEPYWRATPRQPDTFQMGTVHVYDRIETGWSKRPWNATVPTPSGGVDEGGFGYSVSLSASGTILAIGQPNKLAVGDLRGKVLVYDFVGSEWVLRSTLVDIGAYEDYFGYAVALSRDGQFLAVGAPLDGLQGKVTIYEWNSGTVSWDVFQTVSGVPGVDYEFGFSLTFSSDSLALYVGAPGVGLGRVTEFTRVDTLSTFTSNYVINGTGSVGDYFGGSVTISHDDTKLFIGSPYEDVTIADQGRIREYERVGGVWTYQYRFSPVSTNTLNGIGLAYNTSSDELFVGITGYNISPDVNVGRVIYYDVVNESNYKITNMSKELDINFNNKSILNISNQPTTRATIKNGQTLLTDTVQPGTDVRVWDEGTVLSLPQASPVLLQSFVANFRGTARIKIWLSLSQSGINGFGQAAIYINGTRTGFWGVNGGSSSELNYGETYIWDIPISVGDTVQLYAWGTNYTGKSTNLTVHLWMGIDTVDARQLYVIGPTPIMLYQGYTIV